MHTRTRTHKSEDYSMQAEDEVKEEIEMEWFSLLDSTLKVTEGET